MGCPKLTYHSRKTSLTIVPGGRSESQKFTGGYIFGFNGKEMDDEIEGEGNSVHFEYREYDARIGRFKTIDPQNSKYAWQSPYAYHKNNPINIVDYMGLGDKPEKPQRSSVTVSEGDNLWKISRKLLGKDASNEKVQQKGPTKSE